MHHDILIYCHNITTKTETCPHTLWALHMVHVSHRIKQANTRNGLWPYKIQQIQ